MFGLTARQSGHGAGQVGSVCAGCLKSGWKFSFLLSIPCPACAGADGDRGMWCACRGLWVLIGAHNLHGIPKSPLGLRWYCSRGGPWCTCSLSWIYGEVDRLVGRKFTACLNSFEMGKIGSGAKNFKFFWRRDDIWLVVVFCREDIFLLLEDMSLGCVDDSWKIIADESWC